MSIFDDNVAEINKDNLTKWGYTQAYGNDWFSKAIKPKLGGGTRIYGLIIVRFEGTNISAFFYRPSQRYRKMTNTGLRYVTDMFEIIKMEKELQNYLNKLI